MPQGLLDASELGGGLRMADTAQPEEPTIKAKRKDHRVDDPLGQKIWDYVARSPLHNLWDFQGAPVGVVM